MSNNRDKIFSGKRKNRKKKLKTNYFSLINFGRQAVRHQSTLKKFIYLSEFQIYPR